MGWALEFDPRLRVKASLYDEASAQALVVDWAGRNMGRLPALNWLRAWPNGAGKFTYQMARQWKKMGVRGGPSDLFLPVPATVKDGRFAHLDVRYSGLWLEMKVVRTRPHPDGSGRMQYEMGTTSPEQIEWLDGMREQGYATTIAWTAEEGQGALESYLLGQWKQPDMDFLLRGGIGP